MQKKWRSDPDKLTFIVHNFPEDKFPAGHVSDIEIATGVGMVGDTNIFLSMQPESDEADPSKDQDILIAEIEVFTFLLVCSVKL